MATTDPYEKAGERTRIANGNQLTPNMDFHQEKAKMLQLVSQSSSDDEYGEIDQITDQITSIIGKHGLWHWTIWVITGFSIILHGWQSMANKFLTHNTDHWCARPDLYRHLTLQEWANISSPILEDGEFDRCNIYNLNYSNPGIQRPNENIPTIPCSSWEYVYDHFKDSAVERWDMVCERKQYRRYVQMAFFFGSMVGVLLVGMFSDHLGRKTAYLSCLTIWMFFTLCGYFATNPWLWLVFRMLCGAATLSYNTALTVYRMELTSGKWRSRTGHFFGECPWHIGHISLGLVVYLVPNMYNLELVIGLSALPFMALWYFLPESPRWLISKGRLDEAKAILRQACKLNGRPAERVEKIELPPELMEEEYEEAFSHIHHMFAFKGVRRNVISIWICWFAFSMGYFGLIYNTPNFEANIYLVFVTPAIITLPLSICQPYFENHWGRKTVLSGSLITAGTMLLLTMAVPRGEGYSNWPIIILAWAGTSFCSMALGVACTITMEIFPTLYRTIALGFLSAGARVGSLSSPVVAMLDSVHPILPLVVYGITVLIAGIQSIIIWPETTHLHFTRTLEEAEEVASSPNKWLTCCSTEQRSNKYKGKL